jgi:opacity protein-like surface antigen
VTDTDQNDFGWDVGGGLMIFFGDNIGIRGDVRYFHSVELLNVLGFETNTKLDFGRASGAVVFKF